MLVLDLYYALLDSDLLGVIQDGVNVIVDGTQVQSVHELRNGCILIEYPNGYADILDKSEEINFEIS